VKRNSWTGGESWSESTGSGAVALGVHRREDGAFESLVGAFEKPLFNYVQRLVDSVEDAQEVVQDTFLRAHKALTRQYSETRCSELAVRPWLFRIARNLSHNKRRGLRRTVERPFDDGPAPANEPPSPAVSVLCAVERRQEIDRLERSLARLPVATRELLVLRFIEELSYAEIAHTVGTGETALRGKVFRGLRQLRDLLQKEESDHAM